MNRDDLYPLLGILVIILVVLIGTWTAGYRSGLKHAPAVTNTIQVKGDTVTRTVTKIVYTEKTATKNADINATIGKPDLSVQVNGETVTFNKATDERFMFDKNQLQLDQTSKVSFEVQVKPIDMTKHFALGVGWSSGLEILLSGPVSPLLDGYIHGNDKSLGFGAMLRF